MSELAKMPTGGGSYRRDRNGNLTTLEEPTAPAESIPASQPIFGEAPAESMAPPAPPPATEQEA